MKKNIIIFCAILTTLSLTAFGVINLKDSKPDKLETFVIENKENNTVYGPFTTKIEKKIFSDFIYDIGPRFSAIKKGDVDKARYINAFFDKEQIQAIVSLKSVSIIIIIDDKRSDIRETGYSDELTDAQLKLLRSFDYSTNFLIKAEYQQKNKETGKLEDSYSTPHLTIVPEKQAEYEFGKNELMDYLKENSKDARTKANVEADKLQPAKLFFTVTKNGTIENVRLDRTSNYPIVDKAMIELITKAPGTWKPAENSKGEKVNQELVVSFGLMGC